MKTCKILLLLFVLSSCNDYDGVIDCLDENSITKLLESTTDEEDILLQCLDFDEENNSDGITGKKYKISYGQYKNSTLKHVFTALILEKEKFNKRGFGITTTDKDEYLRIKSFFKSISEWETNNQDELVGYIGDEKYVLISLDDMETKQGNKEYNVMIIPKKYAE
jgi:hypothetical protein